MDGARRNRSEAMVYRAGWVVADPWTVYPNGFVHVENDRIREVGAGAVPCGIPITDCGDGAMLPALINAHTHLELSGLKGKLSTESGFASWVRDLLRERALLSPGELIAAADAAISDMIASGCGAVGEISTLGVTRDSLRRSGLSGVWFQEVLGGSMPEIGAEDTPDRDFRTSVAGHALHTTAPDVLKAAKTETRRRGAPFSIHLAESDEEVLFLKTASGPWRDFLMSRGIDPAGWEFPVESPVRYMQEIGMLDSGTILVHVLHADHEDMAAIGQSGAHVCLCPRSNQALHRRLPDIGAMLKCGVRLCLGTDSLASTDSLNLLDEMRFTAAHYPFLSPEIIFQMATSGGARALGIDHHLGSLAPGKMGKLAYAPIRVSSASNVLSAVFNEGILQGINPHAHIGHNEG